MKKRPQSLYVAAAALVVALAGCQGPDDDSLVTQVAAQDEPMVDPIPASEIPPSPVLSPEDALADLEVEPGFRVELVAAEPDVVAPVAMAFDGDGAAWVVEMRGYMPDADATGEDEPVGSIRVLRDEDGDGNYESVSTFLDGLVMPRAIAHVADGILLAEPPNLWHIENDNYVAGKRTLVDSAYAVGGNVEHQPNGLLQAIDNWIYSAKADMRYRFRNGAWEKDRTEFRGQWGLSQDDYGRLFYNHNSATLLGDNVFPNVFPSSANHTPTHRNIGASKAPNTVYPRRINPGVNRAYRKATLGNDGKLATVTGSCGPVVYRGDLFPDTHYGNAFVMEPTGNVVMRVVLRDDDGVVSGSEPYADREFLSATDERFRPVNGYVGPDGALYIVDMYRGVIQHKTYLTEYLRRQIEQRDLELPIDRGRIYRVLPESNGPPSAERTRQPRLKSAPTTQLVDHLSHPNGWWRDTAQRILIQRGDPAAIAPLRRLVAAQSSGRTQELARLHALWTLEGMGELRLRDLQAAGSATRDAKTLATLLRLAAVIDTDDQQALEYIADMRVAGREPRLQRMLSLNAFREAFPDRVAALQLATAASHTDDAEMADAIVGGLEGREDSFQQRLLGKEAEHPLLYAAVEQARFVAQRAPALAALALTGKDVDQYNAGRPLYNLHCATCHGNRGTGLQAQAPTLIASQWVQQDVATPARIALDGVTGPIAVNGKTLRPPEVQDVMPGVRGNEAITDADIAAILTYVRNSWGNRAPAVSPSDVRQVRRQTSARNGNPYTADELESARRADGWVSLMPDASFAGWQKLGGTAAYHIEGDEVVGTTVADSPNTFLATEKHYDDFILEFSVRVDSLINSGVQIRSNALPDYNNGRVHGYQVEIDPSDRAWSAGIYDEGRRGWLFDLRGNPAARKAFRRADWNHYRVEARGPHIRTWINGVLAADLVDDMTPSGFIALQVHSVGAADLVGRTIRWRDLRLRVGS